MHLVLFILFSCTNDKTETIESLCNDGVDNDNDGLLDCDDWDCFNACIETDTNTEDTAEKPEDTGDGNETYLLECKETSIQNQISGSYNGVDYVFNAVIWDSEPTEVTLLMVNYEGTEPNQPCQQLLDGNFPVTSLSLRMYDIVEQGNTPNPVTYEFVEPTGDRTNYAAFVDDTNEIKDAATTGSIVLEVFSKDIQTEGVGSALNLPTFAEGTGLFTAQTINACYCPGLKMTLDQ